MKIYYKSKLAKLVTFFKNFSTIMLFGALFTEKDELSGKVIKHEETHAKQYSDCFSLGCAVGILLMFVLFAVGIQNIWMLLLLLIPLLLFYALYGAEWLIRLAVTKDRVQAYKDISFERHARYIAETWDKPCPEQHHYISFGWLKFINN